MDTFKTARDAAFALRPDQPVYCFRPAVLTADALAFKSAFPGKTAYAVKTNGEPMVLDTLAKAGINCFDVASPAEFAAVRAVAPKAELLYTHPVKAQSDIRLALETYGIRVLALDHEDEVAKILRAVHGLDLDPEEITLLVRLAVRGHAAYELSKKFGAAPGHAVELVQRIARIGFRVGLCFHVGSQVEDTDTYERALASAAWVRSRTGRCRSRSSTSAVAFRPLRSRSAAEGAGPPRYGGADRRGGGGSAGMGLRRCADGGGAGPGDRGARASR